MVDAVAEVVDVDALSVGAVELVGLARPRRLAAAHARLLRARAVVPVRRVVAEPALGDVPLLAVAAHVVDGDGVAGQGALPVDDLLGA